MVREFVQLLNYEVLKDTALLHLDDIQAAHPYVPVTQCSTKLNPRHTLHETGHTSQ
jgi:hypothetical protein